MVPGAMKGKVDRILIIRFSSLGDIVLTTPVIEALKVEFPESRIYFLTKARYGELLKADPRIFTVIEFDPQGKHKGVGGFLKLISELRSHDFDLLVDLHGNIRSFLVRHLIPCRKKLKYRKKRMTRLLMVYCKFIRTEPIHTVDSYLEVLNRLQIKTGKRIPQVFPHHNDIEFTENFLLEHGVKKDDILLGVHPGARWDTKRWDHEKFAQVCQALIDSLGVKVILIGEGREEEVVGKIKSSLPAMNVISAVDFPLGRLTALIARCDCLVSNDSGPMHLASALGVPVVAIFGPTHPKLGFAPLGPKSVALCTDAECSPCSLHGEKKCSKESRTCMDLIEPEMVIKTVEQLLIDKNSNPKDI
jgi:heptosyltransferase-2